jgi:imidazolonepropionase-like amidohydrolase
MQTARAPTLIGLALAACAAAGPSRGASDDHVVRGRLGGAAVELRVEGDRIASVTPARGATPDAWLVPGVIDAHVHLAYWPVAEDVARHGLAAAVDLGAPVRALDALRGSALRVIVSGPMLTRPDGYPLDAWGSDGYGVGCADAAAVRAAIADLAGRGVRIIKIAIADDGLDPALIPVAVAAAHERKLLVAAHALGDRDARLAADAGVDVLVHTPIEHLADDTVAAWRGRVVISTLAAFGGSDAAIDNLRRLRAAGATIVYGTDLGNERDAGPSEAEIELLAKAGLDGEAILDAMTAAPARVFGPAGLGDGEGRARLGALAPGVEASFLILDEDPALHPLALAHPREVWLRGRRIGP